MSLKTESYQINFGSEFLKTQLNPRHELVILAQRIDWDVLEYKLKKLFKTNGRQAKRVRLTVGLLLLKHIYNLSDRKVVQMLCDNLSFRYFCGLQGDLSEWLKVKAIDSSTLTKFRNRLGVEGLKIIEDLIKEQLFVEKRISKRSQLVDTTAQEKNITYPTDSHLLARGMHRIVKSINKLKACGLSVHVRSYKRLIRKEILLINKLGRGRKERIVQGVKKLIGYAHKIRKVAQTIEHAIKKRATKDDLTKINLLKNQLKQDLELVNKVINQSEARLNEQKIPAKDKVFSLHEPHTTVIAKGKRAKRYEFGSKVCISTDKNQYVISHQEYSENIADINTLDPALDDWEKTFGDLPDELGGDRGFHTRNLSEKTSKIKHLAIQSKGSKPHPASEKAYFKRLQRCRNKVEPVIGHLKADHRMDLCRYKGEIGDTLNVGLAVTAWNLKKWARAVRSEMETAA